MSAVSVAHKSFSVDYLLDMCGMRKTLSRRCRFGLHLKSHVSVPEILLLTCYNPDDLLQSSCQVHALVKLLRKHGTSSVGKLSIGRVFK